MASRQDERRLRTLSSTHGPIGARCGRWRIPAGTCTGSGRARLAGIAGTTLDEGERIAAYAEIQSLLASSGPIVIPYFFPQFGAISEDFTGLAMKAFPGRTDLALITLR